MQLSNSSYPGSMEVSRSARGNLVQGDHVTPKAYRAYRWKATPQPFQLRGGWFEFLALQPNQQTAYARRKYEGKAALGVKALGHANLSSNGYYPLVDAGLITLARNSILSQLSKGDLQLGETLGEVRQTGNMLAVRLAQLLRAFRALRQRNYSEAATILGVGKPPSSKSLANAWLEMMYGWKPLMTDIYNGAHAIQELLNMPTAMQYAYSSPTKQDKPTTTWRYKLEGSFLTGVEMKVYYGIDDPWKHGMQQLGISNPLHIAWNLLPLSFVVDWFVSVGSFLEGLSAPHGLSFAYGYQTLYVRGEYTVFDYARVPGQGTMVGNPPSWNCEAFGMSRTRIYGFPKPGVHIRLPLDFRKVLDLLALIAQRR
jgi:hypothetical protein